MSKPLPFIVISGPSGSGKTTLCRKLADHFKLHFVVSHTTRPKRESEIDGHDYYFVSKEIFLDMVARGLFLEHASVYKNLYGTASASVFDYLQKGQGVILDVDTQGARSIQKSCPQALFVFLQAPSLEVLRGRLEKRGTDSPETIAMRLSQASSEENLKHHYDSVVVNDDLDRAYAELVALVSRKFP